MPWDFDNPDKCAKAKRKVQLEKPKLLIGSPMCTAFSQLQALSKDKGNIERKKLLLVRAIKHIRFCVSLYWEQIKNGRYSLHEHPASANSWKLPEIIQLLTYPGVVKVVGHLCAYGMKSTDDQGEGLVKKPTGWMTNSPYIAEQVSALCSNRWKGQMHRHVRLISGRAKAAKVYPPKLCKAILIGLRYQFIADGLMAPGEIGTVCCEEPIITDEVKEEVWGQIQRSYYDSADGNTYYDDITGELLDSDLVNEATQEEMDTYKSHGVYRRVPIAECFEKTGKKPTKVRWVIVNKGDSENPEYRARLVAKEIKMDQRLDLFAATPPLEAKQFLFSLAVSLRAKTGKPYKVLFIDIKRAYFHAKCIRDVYVDLPEQDQQEGMCGKLEKAMYGTRDAAQNWEREYESAFINLGFQQGKSSPCLFYHPDKDLRVVVHGDDFTFLGDDSNLKWITEELKKVYGQSALRSRAVR